MSDDALKGYALVAAPVEPPTPRGCSAGVLGTVLGLEGAVFLGAALAHHAFPSVQALVADWSGAMGHLGMGHLRKQLHSRTLQVDRLLQKNRELGRKIHSAQQRRNRSKSLRMEMVALKEQTHELKERLHKGFDDHPYEAVTSSQGHEWPEMYGHVVEKTIWSYWYDPVDCPNSIRCTLPPAIQLCKETVERNKGSFDHRILHLDEVDRYVNRFELPLNWELLRPFSQKDSLMNALLARYGGVALDISSILLRPLDDDWDEMVAKRAGFRGYAYRLNGRPWKGSEVTAVWFLMARREGLFSSAVRSQVIGMGDRSSTSHYRQWYFALGDQTLLPILSLFNYSLPRCTDDATVPHRFFCPEHAVPPWRRTGDARNDTGILLEDPRDGPQLPFAFAGSASWDVTNATSPVHPRFNGPGFPMYKAGCDSMKTCWEDVFVRRYQGGHTSSKRPLAFIKLFHAGHELRDRSRSELLFDRRTYFFNWLKLAGLPELRRGAASPKPGLS